uniref:Uncharacterized protein n=1 Tax=Pleonosporium borreri TaxID=2575635 RepID=A0A4D6X1S7_9FLOR|nr:hypothetical protein [Pleonosporium borreri]
MFSIKYKLLIIQMNHKLRLLHRLHLLLITIEILHINKYDNYNIIKLKLDKKINIKYFSCYTSCIIKQTHYIYTTIQKSITNNTLKLILQDYTNNIEGYNIQKYLKKYIYIYYQYYNYITFQNHQDIIKIAMINLYLISQIKNSNNPYLSIEYLLIQEKYQSYYI